MENEKNECNFCLKTFSSLSVLTRHKKTSVKCLKLQNKNEICYDYKCVYCDKGFTRKNAHLYHEDTCKHKVLKLNEKVKQLEKDNAYLLIELSTQKKTTTTTNVMINNNNNTNYNFLVPFELSSDDIKKLIEDRFTEDYFRNGQKGVAYFTFENLIKNDDAELMYFCSDTSRKKFVMKDSKGCIKKDHKATLLTSMIAEDITNKSEEIYSDCINKIDPTGLKLISNKRAINYHNNIVDIRSLKLCNTKYSSVLSTLIASVSDKKDEDEEIVYVIEGESEVESD